MKFDRLVVFIIGAFSIALLSSLNSLGMLTSFISSNLSAYVLNIVTALLFVAGLLLFYFLSRSFSLNKSILLTIIIIYAGAVIGYYGAYLILFQTNPLYYQLYGSIIYFQTLFISFADSVPIALACFSGLAIAHLRKEFQLMERKAALEETTNRSEPKEIPSEAPVTGGEEPKGHQGPQTIESEDQENF